MLQRMKMMKRTQGNDQRNLLTIPKDRTICYIKEENTTNSLSFLRKYSSIIVPKGLHDEACEKTLRERGTFKAQVSHNNDVTSRLFTQVEQRSIKENKRNIALTLHNRDMGLGATVLDNQRAHRTKWLTALHARQVSTPSQEIRWSQSKINQTNILISIW